MASVFGAVLSHELVFNTMECHMINNVSLVTSLPNFGGANTLLHGKLNDQVFTASVQGVHRIGGSGEELRLTVSPENIHLFDNKTGKRIE